MDIVKEVHKVIGKYPLECTLGAFLLVLVAMYFMRRSGTGVDAEESCNSDQFLLNGKCKYYDYAAKSECPPGHWSNAVNQCVKSTVDAGFGPGKSNSGEGGANKSIQCSGGQVFDNYLKKCAPPCPNGQFWSDYKKGCRWISDAGKRECPAGQWDDGKGGCAGGKAVENKDDQGRLGDFLSKTTTPKINYDRTKSADGGGKKYEETTGSSIISKVGSTCPTLTKEITSGTHKGKCQRTQEWYSRMRGKDANGKTFTCQGGRVAVGSSCQCDTAGGKMWPGSTCVCDKNRCL